MTAFHEKEDMKEAKELGAFGFLKKPFEFAQLISYIEKRIEEEKNENRKNSCN